MSEIKQTIQTLKERAKNLTLLYVEDEDDLRALLCDFLQRIFFKVEVAKDGLEALQKYKNNQFDLIITDIQMPQMDGMELIKEIKKINAKQDIIVLSAYTDFEYLIESIKLGVSNYIVKPVDFKQIITVLQDSIEKLEIVKENEMYKTNLQEMVKERTAKINHLTSQLVSNYEQVIYTLVKMIEGRDTYTGGHSERVASYSKKIAQAMKLSKDECELIYKAGIVHDIGKILTPDTILLKPSRLTQQEYDLIKEHVFTGYEILNDVSMYKELAQIVYCHHEHYDGDGYPRGLKANEIPLASRIMSVADSFDAMTTSRIYKGSKNIQEAIKELKKYSGSMYDPKVVEVAIEVFMQVEIDLQAIQAPKTHIDEQRFAYFYKDALTQVYNHYYLDYILQKNSSEHLCIYVLYLKNFTKYNKTHGWSNGDVMLKEIADMLSEEFLDFKIFRIFGDDFVLLKRDIHCEIDIAKINDLELLKANELSFEIVHKDILKEDVKAYTDIQKLIEKL